MRERRDEMRDSLKLASWKYLIGAVVVLLGWTLIATRVALNKRASLTRVQRALYYANDKEKNTADRIAEREQNLKYAEKEIERKKITLALSVEKELHKKYDNLYKYKPGKNEVDHSCLEAFEIEKEGNRIKTYMRNKTDDRVKPNLTILFLNWHGFVTESFRKSWVMDSMEPGEKRIDDDSFVFNPRFDEAVYFTIIDD